MKFRKVIAENYILKDYILTTENHILGNKNIILNAHKILPAKTNMILLLLDEKSE